MVKKMAWKDNMLGRRADPKSRSTETSDILPHTQKKCFPICLCSRLSAYFHQVHADFETTGLPLSWLNSLNHLVT